MLVVFKIKERNSNLTVGYNKNEILNLAGVNEIPTGATINGIQNWQLLVEGGEIGAFYGYVSDGIIQLSDTPENTPQFITDTFTPGERKYKDLNGDGVINADNDRAFLGNPIPELTFGLNNSFNWNGFDLNENGKYDWWEYILPIVILLIIEVIAEVIARFLTQPFF